MSYKDKLLKKVRQFERKRLPNYRNKKSYQWIKFILLLPIIVGVVLLDSIQERFKPSDPTNPKKEIILSNIIAGWANLAFTDPKVEELARKRADICASCPFATLVGGLHTIVVDNKTTQVRGLKCSKCGCPLSAKIRSPHDSCPIGLW
jgi:hypothetical protein